MKNSYKTISNYGTDEIIINKSKFIGYAKPIDTEEEALSFIGEISKKHRDATHNVYGYVVGDLNDVQRFSDDGEPSGTAGIPVLEVIKKENLRNVVVVVTRYFGGTKLGAGGLIRAYTKGAKIALEAGNIIDKVLFELLEVKINYSLLGIVENFIQQRNYYVKDTKYLEDISIALYIKKTNVDKFTDEIINLTSDNLSYRYLDERFLSVKDGKVFKADD